MTRIKFSLGLLRKALSLVIDGILFIVSMWFLIGLIGIALLVVITFVFGVLSLFWTASLTPTLSKRLRLPTSADTSPQVAAVSLWASRMEEYNPCSNHWRPSPII